MLPWLLLPLQQWKSAAETCDVIQIRKLQIQSLEVPTSPKTDFLMFWLQLYLCALRTSIIGILGKLKILSRTFRKRLKSLPLQFMHRLGLIGRSESA